ncbi:MAG: alkaline phosphatase family protein [Methanoregula sp.]|nr:alkaline phosphatase family protein [Methanoregula sp.]
MIVVLAIDALEYDLVEKFQCRNLMQKFYGKTNISEFSEPRTMVLWSSFMTGMNMEQEILALGDNGMWNARIANERTFFSEFDNPAIIDLPGYNYEISQHEEERNLLKKFFEAEHPSEKSSVRESYNQLAFEHHKETKQDFIKVLRESHDLVLGYFSVADVIGHLNFGNTFLMKMIYQDLDEIAGGIDSPFLVVSDHGMKPVGFFGDHSSYGFWSSGDHDLGEPKITNFPRIILDLFLEQGGA